MTLLWLLAKIKVETLKITRFDRNPFPLKKMFSHRYFMVLIQEMALKVDQGFLGAIIALFTPATDPEAERKRVTIFIS